MKLITSNFEKLPGVYIVRNTVNGKYYIGESNNIKERMCSHSRNRKQVFHSAISKYGIESFHVEVYYLNNFDKDSRLDLEEQLILKFNSLVPNGYNRSPRGHRRTDYSISEETKSKMREAALRRPKRILSESTKKKIGDAHRGRSGRKPTPESIAKFKETIKTSETYKASRKLIGEKLKGRKQPHRSIEWRQNLSKSLTGNKLSEDTKKKLSIFNKGRVSPMKGRKFSDETRKKMSFSAKGKSKKPITEETRERMRDAAVLREQIKRDKRMNNKEQH
jgi:group I intron endonuclease